MKWFTAFLVWDYRFLCYIKTKQEVIEILFCSWIIFSSISKKCGSWQKVTLFPINWGLCSGSRQWWPFNKNKPLRKEPLFGIEFTSICFYWDNLIRQLSFEENNYSMLWKRRHFWLHWWWNNILVIYKSVATGFGILIKL